MIMTFSLLNSFILVFIYVIYLNIYVFFLRILMLVFEISLLTVEYGILLRIIDSWCYCMKHSRKLFPYMHEKMSYDLFFNSLFFYGKCYYLEFLLQTKD